MTDIKITIGKTTFEAVVYATPTGKSILDCLPFDSSTNTWGDEIYFHTPAVAHLEADSREVVEVGDLAYWPTMPAFCIFFGPTPVSRGSEPRAASEVNVFGRLKEVDLDLLRSIDSGEDVKISM